MIRIACYPKCFEYEIGLHHTMTVYDWIAMARAELPVEGLEMYERFLPSTDRGEVERLRDAIREAGFAMPMFIASPDLAQPDASARQRAVEHQAAMMRVAAQLGGPGVVCRVLSGQCRPEVSREQGVEWVVECILQLVPLARELDVVLGMENHYKDSQWLYPEFALRMDVFLEIVNGVAGRLGPADRGRFGVQYDPSNAIIAGDDPLELLEAVAGQVVSMHASDRALRPGVTREQLAQAEGALGYAPLLQHGVVGQGMNGYDRIFAALKQAGYHGWVSIEDGLNGMEDMRRSLAFLEGMRAKHFG